jgi:hypothetical protein
MPSLLAGSSDGAVVAPDRPSLWTVSAAFPGCDILPVGIVLGGSLSQRLSEAPLGVVIPALGSHRRWRRREVGNNEVGSTVKKTSAALLAVPVVASILLSGCGGSNKTDASRSSTANTSPASTAAPTSSAPTTSVASRTTDPNIPAAARAHSTAGAEAFVRYFIERWNVAWTGPRPGILSPLCQSSSNACTALERSAARLTNAGHHYDGNPVTIKFIGVLDAKNPKGYEVLANLVQERRNEIDGAGKIYVTDQRKDFRVQFVLMDTGQGWFISSLKLMK